MTIKTTDQHYEQIVVSGSPIAVFQMGKVGSETIVKTLEQLDLLDSVHHVHFLAHESIDREFANVEDKNYPLTTQLRHSRVLRDYLDREDESPIHVITATREPVAQFVSAVFQNIPVLMPHLIGVDGVWKKDEIQELLVKAIENYTVKTERNCNWFTTEFEPALGINVYEYPFDLETGIATIEKDGVRVLILRLETSDLWCKALSGFLALDRDLKLINKNSATDKMYHSVYESVKANLGFSEDVLDRIYSTQYCNHFYSESLITSFKSKWIRSTQVPNAQPILFTSNLVI